MVVICDLKPSSNSNVFSLQDVWGAPEADLITNLPGLSFKPNFKQYSGYLNGVATRRLHYWSVACPKK
ncbi:hypothetical protein RRG08_009278 [Elysia crispata]|uniref:Uncharacterized protein n=1 Tax=Elysia crispata TaxID=231223 RepID=A0AAE1DK17_9GAST|nr:hypothetical protein RRG08_009278 [Elysia crispata]